MSPILPRTRFGRDPRVKTLWYRNIYHFRVLFQPLEDNLLLLVYVLLLGGQGSFDLGNEPGEEEKHPSNHSDQD